MFTLKYLNQLCAFVCIVVFAVRGDYWWALMSFLMTFVLDRLIDLASWRLHRK